MSQQLRSATEAGIDGLAGTAQPVGEEFVRALAGKDGAALRAVLAGPIDFAALTPGRHWTASSSDEVIVEIMLGRWFDARSEILGIEALGGGVLPGREHVSYRLRVRRSDGDYLVEQQAYYNTDGGRISWLRVLCSGYNKTNPR